MRLILLLAAFCAGTEFAPDSIWQVLGSSFAEFEEIRGRAEPMQAELKSMRSRYDGMSRDLESLGRRERLRADLDQMHGEVQRLEARFRRAQREINFKLIASGAPEVISGRATAKTQDTVAKMYLYDRHFAEFKAFNDQLYKALDEDAAAFREAAARAELRKTRRLAAAGTVVLLAAGAVVFVYWRGRCA